MNNILKTKRMPRLGDDFIGPAILAFDDNKDLAEASLDFLKNQGIKLDASYDHLYAAIKDPHYGGTATKEILELMNEIAPKGCRLTEINPHVWGFV